MTRTVAAALALVAAALALPRAAAAQDRFEIQVYDAATAERHHPGLEVHLNLFTEGSRDRSPEGEVATHGLFHLTLEPHLGVTTWWEAGAYLQLAVRGDGGFDYGGVKLRSKLRLPDRLLHGVLGLAINFELSIVPGAYEANVWGTEVRPVIDLRWWRVSLWVNPIVGTDLGGPLAGRPQLQPAVKLAYTVTHDASVGVEYYGGFGPVGEFFPASQQSHKIFGVVDARIGSADLDIGVGYGTLAAERWIVKAIVGREL